MGSLAEAGVWDARSYRAYTSSMVLIFLRCHYPRCLHRLITFLSHEADVLLKKSERELACRALLPACCRCRPQCPQPAGRRRRRRRRAERLAAPFCRPGFHGCRRARLENPWQRRVPWNRAPRTPASSPLATRHERGDGCRKPQRECVGDAWGMRGRCVGVRGQLVGILDPITITIAY
jgi:hypothetical protein